MRRGSNRLKTEPYAPKVEKVDLTERNKKLRIILAVVFVCIAGAAFAFGLSSLREKDPVWEEISALNQTTGRNPASDLVLYYELGAGNQSVKADRSAVTAIYVEAAERAEMAFSADDEADFAANLYTINRNPNTELTVSEELYRAFELLERMGDRYMYLGPVYTHYYGIYYAGSDDEAREIDPRSDDEAKEFCERIATFARDEKSVDLVLLGGNKVRLDVSDDYLKYAKEHGIYDFIDLFKYKNAFVIDYIGDVLTENRYLYGIISSYDGYSLSLSEQIEPSVSIIGGDKDTKIVAEAKFKGHLATARYDAPALGTYNGQRLYVWQDGSVTGDSISLEDGLTKCSVPHYLAASSKLSCAELAVMANGVFCRDEFEPLETENLFQLWVEEGNLFVKNRFSDPNVYQGLNLSENYVLKEQ